MSSRIQSNRVAAAAAGFVLLAGGLISLMIGTLDGERRQAEARNRTLIELSVVRTKLEAEIKTTFTVTEGMVHLIGLDGGIAADRFADMARLAMGSARHIRNIALAPDNVVTQVFPRAGNEAVIGFSYDSSPEQRLTVSQARNSGHPLLAGPVALVQGGEGLIQRTPVFTRQGLAADAPPRYWGLVSVVARADSLFEAGGLREGGALHLALRGKDGLGDKGD